MLWGLEPDDIDLLLSLRLWAAAELAEDLDLTGFSAFVKIKDSHEGEKILTILETDEQVGTKYDFCGFQENISL